MQKKIIFLTILSLFFCGLPCAAVGQDSNQSNTIEFVDIPGNGKDIKPFKMGKTEVTNQQYVDFLNAALRKNKIKIGKIEPTDPTQLAIIPIRAYKSRNQQYIYDKNGNRMLDLLGVRVTGDHNRNRKYELWEMENPLSRCMIEYDSDKRRFQVVDPKKVNWEIYFDNKHLPDRVRSVDSITNWAELHEFWPAGVALKGRKVVSWDRGDYNKDVLFAGHLDLDYKLPLLEEVKTWPVNHIEYYGAKAFADFYGFDLPTFKEFQWAAAGGKGYKYGTDDGTINTNNVVYSGHAFDEYPKLSNRRFDFANFPGKDKGHVQPVASFAPNPYGVYDLSGNVYEWSKSKNNDEIRCKGRLDKGFESFVRIGGSWNYYDNAQSFVTKECKETSINRGNDHFGFRVVKR